MKLIGFHFFSYKCSYHISSFPTARFNCALQFQSQGTRKDTFHQKLQILEADPRRSPEGGRGFPPPTHQTWGCFFFLNYMSDTKIFVTRGSHVITQYICLTDQAWGQDGWILVESISPSYLLKQPIRIQDLLHITQRHCSAIIRGVINLHVLKYF